MNPITLHMYYWSLFHLSCLPPRTSVTYTLKMLEGIVILSLTSYISPARTECNRCADARHKRYDQFTTAALLLFALYIFAQVSHFHLL